MRNVSRREFISGLSVGSLGVIAGCGEGETQTPTPEQESFELPELERIDAVPTPDSDPLKDSQNTLSVTEWPVGESYVSAYSAVNLRFTLEFPISTLYESLRVLVLTQEYPRGETVAYGTSSPVSSTEQGFRALNLSLTDGAVPRDTRLFHSLFAMPAAVPVENLTGAELVFLTETDPFMVSSSTNQIGRNPPPYVQQDEKAGTYEREAVEGAYTLFFDGQTDGRSWTVGLVVWKSSYAHAREEPRDRGYEEYVTMAETNGNASALATILNDVAEENSFTGKRAKVEMIIDWVQSLPYVTDEVSRGYDEYPKFVSETLVDADGDCEDTSILLAAILQAEPLGYDVVLLSPPGHMAVGIYGEKLPGYSYRSDGRDYYYIETTGEGWGIGDLPEEYQGTGASIYRV